MSSGGNWSPTTRNATKALRFTETGTVYRRNALRNVDHQFIPFGNGNFPKPLTGVRFCARWQRDGERASERASLSRCGRGTTGHVFVLGSPPTDVSKPRRQRRALSRTRRGSFKRSFSFRNRWRNFGHAPRAFLEICGNFNWKRIGCLVGKGDIVLNL